MVREDSKSLEMTGKVYIVHCVDTEGPLNETLEATFQRISHVAGVEFPPSYETLKKIQRKEINLDGREEMLAMAFSERLLSYNRDWTDLDNMLDKLTDSEFRMKYSDSEGNGWKYTWFIMDHINYDINPRNKIVGYNAIWDHYQEYYRIKDITDDEFQWHAHPASTYREGNRCGSSYWNSPHIMQSLAHRLIDRGFFPSSYRPGYHTERPDSHWFLEQYIPYDFANQSIEQTENDRQQDDLSGGRFGDWRRAPNDWSWYNPSHDDYQIPGDCRRVIFRCLNIGTRIRLLTQKEVDKAFKRAEEGYDTILAFCDHDFRDMSYDIDDVYSMIKKAEKKRPQVKWINSTSFEAAKKVLRHVGNEIRLSVCFKRLSDRRVALEVKTEADSFGPQPFFAVKMRNGEYRVENMDVQKPKREWTFVFDEDSIHADDVLATGIATNSMDGSGELSVITPDNIVLFNRKW